MMRWPVWFDEEPVADPWTVGDRVTEELSWWDDAGFPPDLIGDGADFDARRVMDDGRLLGQILTAGGVTALRRGHGEEGRVRLPGCLVFDRYLWPPPGVLTPTTGTVLAIQRVPASALTERRNVRGFLASLEVDDPL